MPLALLAGITLLLLPRSGMPVPAQLSPTHSRGEATILKLRVGTYPTYTRVVLETATPLEWSVDTRGPEGLSIVVPGGVLSPAVRSVELPHGILRAVLPRQQPGGVEVSLLARQESVSVRSLALMHPDRIVVDVLQAENPGHSVSRAHGEPIVSPHVGEIGGFARGHSPAAAGSESTPRRDAGASHGPASGGGGFTVVLDPGHGGQDTGAIGPTGLPEKEVVLDLALRLRQLLQDRLGLHVLLTRSADVFVPLAERSALANRVKADFFVSLHLNGSAQRDAVGFETFYYTREPSDSDARTSVQRENLVLGQDHGTGRTQSAFLRSTLADLAVARDMQESSDLAELELASLNQMMGVANRGVKSGPFYVLATAAMPAVLVESAFITNPREEQKLRQDAYRQRLADALCEGIRTFTARYSRRVGRGGASTPPGS